MGRRYYGAAAFLPPKYSPQPFCITAAFLPPKIISSAFLYYGGWKAAAP